MVYVGMECYMILIGNRLGHKFLNGLLLFLGMIKEINLMITVFNCLLIILSQFFQFSVKMARIYAVSFIGVTKKKVFKACFFFSFKY